MGEAPTEEFWFTRFEADVEATLPRFGEDGGRRVIQSVTDHWTEVDWTGVDWTHENVRNKLINHWKQN